MRETSGKWADLGPRIVSGLVLVVVGFGAIWLGGAVFVTLIAAAVFAITWEIARMLAPGRDMLALSLGAIGAAACLAGVYAGLWPGIVGAFAVALVGAGALGAEHDRVRFMAYSAYVVLAAYGLTVFRGLDQGLVLVFWIVALVAATDVAGYFVGRIAGGPKFWPRVSPKKTWSGTVAGWIAAGLVGWAFSGALGPGAVWLSVILSFASQMGDAAESALKRSAGIKDASNLIPGHGGVFDRFDAMLGASFALFIAFRAGFFGG